MKIAATLLLSYAICMNLPNDRKEGMISEKTKDGNDIEVMNDYDDSDLGDFEILDKKNDLESKNIEELDSHDQILNGLINSLYTLCIEITQDDITEDEFIKFYTSYLDFLIRLEDNNFYASNLQQRLKKIIDLIWDFDHKIMNAGLKFYENSVDRKIEPLLQKHVHLRSQGAIFKKRKEFLQKKN